MNRIPPAVLWCDIPDTFTPSRLASADLCLLRVVLESMPGVPELTAHPTAAIGRVFHRLLEAAVRGEIERRRSLSEDVARALDELLDQEERRLAGVWPDPIALRAVHPPAGWLAKSRVVLDLAERYAAAASSPRRKRTPASAAGAPPAEAAHLPFGDWPEVRLETPELRLKGRVDLLELRSGGVTIRDLKTGRVHTAEGEVLPGIERQMRLYGVMARTIWPDLPTRLLVDHGVERVVSFGPEEEQATRTWLREHMDRLSVGEHIKTRTLATVGEGCTGCISRHVCPVYRDEAPNFWRQTLPFTMPFDIWGEVVAVVGVVSENGK